MSLRWDRLAASGKTLGVAAGNCCRSDRRRGVGVAAVPVRAREDGKDESLECSSCGTPRRGSRSRRGCSGRKVGALHLSLPGRCARRQRACCVSWEAGSLYSVKSQGSSLLGTYFFQGALGWRTSARHQLLWAGPRVFLFRGVASSRCVAQGQAEDGRFGNGAELASAPGQGGLDDGHGRSQAESCLHHHGVDPVGQEGGNSVPSVSTGSNGMPKKRQLTFIVFDIETTGFKRGDDRIIEFAARDLAGGENSTLQALVNPEGVPVGSSFYTHGISDMMINNPETPRWDEVAPTIVEFVESRRKGNGLVLLVAHNARVFDVPFLISHFERSSVQLPEHWLFLDTLPLAKDVMAAKGGKGAGLSALHDFYKLPDAGQAHRGMPDVNVLVSVLQYLMRDLRLTPDDLVERAFRASDCKKRSQGRSSDEATKRGHDFTACTIPDTGDTELSSVLVTDKVVHHTEEAIDEINEEDGSMAGPASGDDVFEVHTETLAISLEPGLVLQPVSLEGKNPTGLDNNSRGHFFLEGAESQKRGPTLSKRKRASWSNLSQDAAVIPDHSYSESPSLGVGEFSPDKQVLEIESSSLLTSVVDTALLNPMLRQYVETKRQRPKFLLLSRVGDFYEAFFEDAEQLSQACNIRLASLDGGKMLDKKVPMAGVPSHRVEVYLKTLLDKGIAVAKQDQVAADVDGNVGHGIQREVTALFTPGTVLDHGMLENCKNNFLVAILPPSSDTGVWGLAFSDISTGEFRVTHSHGRHTLVQEILRLQPSEIIHPSNVQCLTHETSGCVYPVGMPPQLCYAERPNSDFFPSSAKKKLLACFGVDSLESLGMQEMSYGLRAAGGLVSYLQETQKVSSGSIPLCTPHPYSVGHFMHMDETVRSHLELLKTSRRASTEGTLLWAMDRTRTAMGSRLLRQWLLLPLLSHEDICCRHDAVEILASDHQLRHQLMQKLSAVGDLERLAGRVAWKRADARDLLMLAQSLQVLPSLQSLLCDLAKNMYLHSFEHTPLEVLSTAHRVQAMLSEEPSRNSTITLIRSGVDEELERLREQVKEVELLMSSYEKQEQQRLSIPALEIGYARQTGRYISIPRGKHKKEMIPSHYLHRQSLRSEERYTTPELVEYDRKRAEAVMKVLEREEQLFIDLRDEMGSFLQPLRDISRGLAALDVLVNFAELAVERDYCRPEMLEQGRELTIVKGRHAVVEAALPPDVHFVANSTFLGFCSARSEDVQEGGQGEGQSLSSTATADRCLPSSGLVAQEVETWYDVELSAEKHQYTEALFSEIAGPTAEEETVISGQEFQKPEDEDWPRPDLALLTGPNASGKSCYLRQIGLIQLMAQAGSFVPAEKSRLTIADGIYTRIGSVDDLAAGHSSFKVEMMEIKQILDRATSRSLVLVDEVGRGTGAQEGEAIARAVIEYLSQHIRARTVLSTHYHNLHALDEDFPNVSNFHFDATHLGSGALIFDHALKPGYCLHSYGIEVGRLSGVPEWVCSRAEELLRTPVDSSSRMALNGESMSEEFCIGLPKMSPSLPKFPRADEEQVNSHLLAWVRDDLEPGEGSFMGFKSEQVLTTQLNDVGTWERMLFPTYKMWASKRDMVSIGHIRFSTDLLQILRSEGYEVSLATREHGLFVEGVQVKEALHDHNGAHLRGDEDAEPNKLLERDSESFNFVPQFAEPHSENLDSFNSSARLQKDVSSPSRTGAKADGSEESMGEAVQNVTGCLSPQEAATNLDATLMELAKEGLTGTAERTEGAPLFNLSEDVLEDVEIERAIEENSARDFVQQNSASGENCRSEVDIKRHSLPTWEGGRYQKMVPWSTKGMDPPKWDIWFGKRSHKGSPNGAVPEAVSNHSPDSGSSEVEGNKDLTTLGLATSGSTCQFMSQEELDSTWKQVHEFLRTKPATQALTKQKGSLVSISKTSENLIVCLGAPALFVKKFQQHEHATALQSAFQSVLQQAVELNITLVGGPSKH